MADSAHFANRTVLITGAGAGIGRALAIGFARDGARVFAFGRTASTLEQSAALALQENPAARIQVMAGDVGNADDVAKLFAFIASESDGADILINNAAIYPRTAFLESTPESWAEVMLTNVVGVADCCRHALPGMLDRQYGRILNVSSFAWMAPIANAAAYSSSKGAVRALTRSLAAEIDADRYPDILVNEFVPGAVKTSMSDQGIDPDAVYPLARAVVDAPGGSATGRTYNGAELHEEDYSLKARLRRKLGI